MKLIVTSDLHGNLPEISQDHDITIINGDIYPDKYWDYYRNLAIQEEWHYKKFVPWLKNLKSNQIFISAGNHDNFIAHNICYQNCLPDKCIYFETSGIEVDCKKFWFSPWCPDIPGRNFPFTNRKEILDANANLIPKDVHILVTHCPQSHVLDFCPIQQRHFGSTSLTEIIPSLSELQLHLVGHIHGIQEYIVHNGRFTTINSAERVIEYIL